jgi:hypothetical protein
MQFSQTSIGSTRRQARSSPGQYESLFEEHLSQRKSASTPYEFSLDAVQSAGYSYVSTLWASPEVGTKVRYYIDRSRPKIEQAGDSYDASWVGYFSTAAESVGVREKVFQVVVGANELLARKDYQMLNALCAAISPGKPNALLVLALLRTTFSHRDLIEEWQNLGARLKAIGANNLGVPESALQGI